MRPGAQPFSAVRTEGGLLPQDLLGRIQAGDDDLTGTQAESYHLGPHERIGEAVNRSWSRLVGTWRAFQEALEKSAGTGFATGLTRDRWLLPLFQEFGYGRLLKGRAITIEGKSYAISHTWHHSPIHLLGCRVDLDRRQKGVAGAAKASPHGLVQEFLNRSDDHLWGFLSNGYRLRLLRDHHSLTRQAYIEFDLQAIMDGEQYSEFLLLWLLCHQSRVEADKPEESWLEVWAKRSRDEGVRALAKLRDGVEEAIKSFGMGFLAHPANSALREALGNNELDKDDYYRQLLRLVYRLIFLFVAEEREALLDPRATDVARERYRRYYAMRRLRELAERRRGSRHSDLWRGLVLVMEKLDDGCSPLALPALGSRLWDPGACPRLMAAECSNEHVLSAIRYLSYTHEDKTRYPVNWRNIGADELGSVYESLLERRPTIHKEAAKFELETVAGHERKTTGSYYTPTALVDCLLDSALDPVLDEACQKPDPEAAVLDLKVCDPACGSGHFLVAAARRLAKRLAAIRSGDDEPSPRDVQSALRDVIGRCIYGVDLNPMAVELCKVSLWMEAIEPGKPLSFLDSHIQCGNALLGATPALMSRGLPDAAFKAIEGDDKEVAKRLKKRNRSERKGQRSLFGLFAETPRSDYGTVAKQAADVEKAADDSISAVREKERLWGQLARSPEFKDTWFQADAWCSAFVWPKQPGELEDAAITHDTWLRIASDVSTAAKSTRKTVRSLARRYRLFHWHLAFPQVLGETKEAFENDETTGWPGGFDLVLGNPPWERVKLQEKEFFASHASEVANARNAAARKKAIKQLEEEDPKLWAQWKLALREADSQTSFIRNSGRYPLCGRGDVNTYPLFAEYNLYLLNQIGRSGFITPTGIATDAGTSTFFRHIVETASLAELISFENYGTTFGSVNNRQSFCLMTLSRKPVDGMAFEFKVNQPLPKDAGPTDFTLRPGDIKLLNPNTMTCPTFRTRRDAEINKRIYKRVGVLWSEYGTESNPWNITFKRLFDMANDSNLFRGSEELEAARWSLHGNRWTTDEEHMVPMYEAKMVQHYDHRFATRLGPGQSADGRTSRKFSGWYACGVEDPTEAVWPRYWVNRQEVERRFENRWAHGWLLGWRDICRSTDFRTVIAGVIPRVAVNDKFLLMLPRARPVGALLANLTALVFDYFARQKLGGTSLKYFTMRQLPVLPPREFYSDCPWHGTVDIWSWMRPRVLELSFTAWDMEAFANECGYNGPPFQWNEVRRQLLQRELDVAFFQLYGIDRNDLGYIIDTFTVIKKRDLKIYGDYRTKLQILDIYDRMQHAIDSGEPYQTLLDPPPADPRVAHPESTRPDWAKRDS